MANQSAGVSVVSRAVKLLEAFDAGVRDLSATQIASRADLPLTTAHRLLGELTEVGLLEKLPNRRYRIGLKLWEIAVRTPGALGIREIATPALRAAHRLIGQHVQLSVLQEGDTLYLERLSAPNAVINLTIIGGRLPFTATSSGHVLVAFSEPSLQEQLIQRPRPRSRFVPSFSNDELAERLRVVRRQGYEIAHGYIHPDATSLAVPVFGPLSDVVASVSAVVPTEDVREEAVLATLQGAAHQIRTALTRHYSGRNNAEQQ
ncbi:MAG TPA: IclR family transcriptional regulator [Pseudolysinimonas sp.]|nr:IclR family transcriptional regulator [Pseudolysinimonas sp.]